MALLDRNGLYGAPRFHMAAQRAGTRAHIGAEIAVRDAGERLRPPQWLPHRIPAEPVRWHCSPKPRAAIRISAASSPASSCASRTRPKGRRCWPMSPSIAEGLVCLTGGDEGPLAAALARGGYDAALHEVERLMHIFGPRNVFVELQRHFERERSIAIRPRCASHARCIFRCWPPMESTMPHAYEREVLDVLTTIRHHCTLETAGRLLALNSERYLRSAARDAAALPRSAGGDRQHRRAFRPPRLRDERSWLPLPGLSRCREGETMQSFLEKRTDEGIRNRYLPKHDDKLFARAQKQAQRELALIAKLGLAGYFLIVWDIVQFCGREGILVQGRGSAANSVVCYALGITAVDPVGMDLLFERFLSEERGEWPDIDLDLPSGTQREQAIQYVYQRYGELGAAMTANVITYRGRSAAREAGKALGFDAETLNRLTKLVSAWEWKRQGRLARPQLSRCGL